MKRWTFLSSVCLASVLHAHAATEAQARAVYKHMCAVAGITNAAPELVLESASTMKRGLWVDFAHNPVRIVFEQQALDVCSTFGKDADAAIAFLLGHELSHFTMAHDWGEEFRSQNDHKAIGEDIGEAARGLSVAHFYEIQADQRGAFYSAVAGYNIDPLADSVVARLYRSYGWHTVLKGYPDLPDRLTLLKQALVRSNELNMLLRVANYRALLGQYEDAQRLYDILMGEGVRDPVILNNAALCYFLQAQPLAPEQRKRIEYPLALDLREGGWRGGATSSFDALTERCGSLLLEAYLMDRTDPVVLGNLACLALLAGDRSDATHWVEKRKALHPADRVDLILAALLNELIGDKDKALAGLNDPLLKTDAIAMRNRAVISGNTESAPSTPADKEWPALSISGKHFADLAAPDHLLAVEVRSDTILFYGDAKNCWKLYEERTSGPGIEKGLWLVGVTGDASASGNSGPRIGMDRSEIERTFGPAAHSMPTYDGEVAVIGAGKKPGLIVQYDSTGHLTSWTMYQEFTP